MMNLLLTFLWALLPLSAPAGGGIPLLDQVPGHRVVFSYTYSLSQDGRPMAEITRGTVTVEDNAYRMTGLGLEVYSNGTTRWSVDRAAEEVVIETVGKEDVFSNPALFIGAYRDYMDRITVHSAGTDRLDVTLQIDDQVLARFVLTGIRFMERQGKSDFTLDVKPLPSSYVITDLR